MNRVNKTMKKELTKKILTTLKDAQAQMQSVLADGQWMDEAKKYAERQGKELQKILKSDLGKVVQFIEKEKKEIEKVQKQIPNEVKRLKVFVTGQRKEFEKLLNSLKKMDLTGTSSKKTGTKKAVKVTKTISGKKTTKSTSAKKTPTKTTAKASNAAV